MPEGKMQYRSTGKLPSTEVKAKYVGKFVCNDEDREDMLPLLHRNLPSTSKHLQKVKVRLSEKGLSCSDRNLFREAIYCIAVSQINDSFVDPINDGVVYFVCPKHTSYGTQNEIHSFLCKSHQDATTICAAYWRQSKLAEEMEVGQHNFRQMNQNRRGDRGHSFVNDYVYNQPPPSAYGTQRSGLGGGGDTMSMHSEPVQRASSSYYNSQYSTGRSTGQRRGSPARMSKLRDGGGESSSDESGIGYSSGGMKQQERGSSMHRHGGYTTGGQYRGRSSCSESGGNVYTSDDLSDFYEGGRKGGRYATVGRSGITRGDGSAHIKLQHTDIHAKAGDHIETQSLPPADIMEGGGTLVRKMRKITTRTERKPKDGGPPVIEVKSHVEPVEEYKIPGHLDSGAPMFRAQSHQSSNKLGPAVTTRRTAYNTIGGRPNRSQTMRLSATSPRSPPMANPVGGSLRRGSSMAAMNGYYKEAGDYSGMHYEDDSGFSAGWEPEFHPSDYQHSAHTLQREPMRGQRYSNKHGGMRRAHSHSVLN